MKTLKQIKEEYDEICGVQGDKLSEQMMLEDKKDTDKKVSFSKPIKNVPSPRQMPNLLLFRRITYRRYPGDQVVALYYSKSVDKYLSIPFGPTGNLNLSEATIYDTMEELELNEGAKWEAAKGAVKGALHGAARGLARGNAIAAEPGMAIGGVVGAVHGAYKGGKEAYKKAKDSGIDEDWQDVNRKDKTSGLSQKAVNAYRREHPGSKLQTAVTEKNPTGKRAARRKSFCSRMGGMKKRLTSAKTARDPDSNINKALRRWNCEEDFKLKLAEMRMQQEGVVGDTIEKGRQWAQDKVKGSKTFKAAQEIGHHLPGYGNVKAAKEKWSKGDKWGAAKEAGKSLAKAAMTGAAVSGAGAIASRVGGAALGALASKAADVVSGGDKTDSDVIKKVDTGGIRKAQVKSYKPSMGSSDSDPVTQSRLKTAALKDAKNVQENKIADIRKFIKEESDSMNLMINGRCVTLNNSMGKRILEVYDSVNTKNKKIVEGMLNNNMESFKRLLNFSIRN